MNITQETIYIFLGVLIVLSIINIITDSIAGTSFGLLLTLMLSIIGIIAKGSLQLDIIYISSILLVGSISSSLLSFGFKVLNGNS
jgi:hypothetical protein